MNHGGKRLVFVFIIAYAVSSVKIALMQDRGNSIYFLTDKLGFVDTNMVKS